MSNRRHYFAPLATQLERCRSCYKLQKEGNHCVPPAIWLNTLRVIIAKKGALAIPTFRPIDITHELAWHPRMVQGRNVVRGLLEAGMVQCITPGRGRWHPGVYELTDWGRATLQALRDSPRPDKAPRAGGSL